MNWNDWIAENKKKLEHIAGYEESFVRNILSKIPEISPRDVLAQCHFKDAKGGNRYIDFLIQNESKGYRLPVELDGHWKVRSYREFNDMLERQNDLMSIYGVLLRYTNKKVFNEPEKVIREIKKTLDLQSKNQLSEKIIQEQSQARFDQYQLELNQIKEDLKKINKNSETNLESNYESVLITSSEILNIQNSILELKNSFNQKLISENRTNTKQKSGLAISEKNKTSLTSTQVTVSGIIFLILVVLSAIIFYSKDSDQNKANDPQKESGTLSSNVILGSNQSSLANGRESISNEDLSYNEMNIESDPAELPKETTGIKIDNDMPDFDISPLNSNPSLDDILSEPIPASSASENIGNYRITCGTVIQIKDFSKGKYLNLGASYPNQDTTIVVWNSDLYSLGDIDQYEGKRVCIEGTIDSYRGKSQIKLSSLDQLR